MSLWSVATKDLALQLVKAKTGAHSPMTIPNVPKKSVLPNLTRITVRNHWAKT